MRFADVGLSPLLLGALEGQGLVEAMPVQAMAIPPALEGRDLLVLSATGSGKTLAFAIPLLDRLLASEDGAGEARGGKGRAGGGGRIKALILVPTRELASQVGRVLEGICGRLRVQRPPRVRLAHGGVSINPQMLALRAGADILVTTPGRLLDLCRHNAVQLSELRFLVLDEADRMLDAGFAEELGSILSLLPRNRQSLLFSATFSEAEASLLGQALRDPLRLGKEALPPTTEGGTNHRAFSAAAEAKGPLLRRLLSEGRWERALVFTSSNRRADNVARKLNNNGISSLALHGDLSQAARTTGLEAFRKGAIKVLVASDLASRGLDIKGLPVVINYELPRSALDYVHRAGRTGRAGAEGLVLSLIAPEEEAMLRLVCKRSGLRITLEKPPA